MCKVPLGKCEVFVHTLAMIHCSYGRVLRRSNGDFNQTPDPSLALHSSSRPGQAQTAMKRKKKTCQTSINAHPAHAPKGKQRTGSRSSTKLPDMLPCHTGTISLYSICKMQTPPSLRTEREEPELSL